MTVNKKGETVMFLLLFYPYRNIIRAAVSRWHLSVP